MNTFKDFCASMATGLILYLPACIIAVIIVAILSSFGFDIESHDSGIWEIGLFISLVFGVIIFFRRNQPLHKDTIDYLKTRSGNVKDGIDDGGE